MTLRSVGKLYQLRCISMPNQLTGRLLCAAPAFTVQPHEKKGSMVPPVCGLVFSTQGLVPSLPCWYAPGFISVIIVETSEQTDSLVTHDVIPTFKWLTRAGGLSSIARPRAERKEQM